MSAAPPSPARRRSFDPPAANFGLLTIPAGPITSERPDARALRAGLQDLLAKLPARLLIGCHRRGVERIAEWVRGRAEPATIVPLDDDLDFSFWGQDACLAGRHGVSGE